MSCDHVITYVRLVALKDVRGNGIPWDSCGNSMGMGTQICQKMVTGTGRVHVTMGMGMATFSRVPKFPSVDSMRM